MRPTAVAIRQAIEKKIVKKTLETFTELGYVFSVYDGGEQHPVTSNIEEAMEQIFAVDEAHLHVFSPKLQEEIGTSNKCSGWIWFVMGNDGWDVICDYTVGLEEILKPVEKYIDNIADSL